MANTMSNHPGEGEYSDVVASDTCPCGFSGIYTAVDPKGRRWCNVCCPGNRVWSEEP